MNEPQVLDADRFDELVRRLAGLSWPLGVERAREVVGEWGWAVREELPVGSLVVDTGYGFDGGWPGAFHVSDGAVTSVFVRTTDHVADPPARVARVMLAAYGYFADRVAATLGDAGQERDQEGYPESAWTLAGGAELVLTRDPETSALRLAAPAAEPAPEPASEPTPEPTPEPAHEHPTGQHASAEVAVPPTDAPEPAPSTGEWAAFEEALVPAVAGLTDRGRLVLNHRPAGAVDGDYYLQLAADVDRGLSIEAVADHFLPEPLRLGSAGAERMRQLGWSEPVPSGDWQGNWSVGLPFPPPAEELAPLARLLTVTLRDVFGAPEPAALTYEAWRDSAPDGSEPRQPLFLTELEAVGVR